MKYLLFIVFIFLAGKAFGQTQPIQPHKAIIAIATQDAYKHMGELVEVNDSLYNGKIVNDTTAVFQVGRKTSISQLFMIYINRNYSGVTSTIDPKIVEKLQRAKIYIYGVIKGTTQAPEIIVDGANGHIGQISLAH